MFKYVWIISQLLIHWWLQVSQTYIGLYAGGNIHMRAYSYQELINPRAVIDNSDWNLFNLEFFWLWPTC